MIPFRYLPRSRYPGYTWANDLTIFFARLRQRGARPGGNSDSCIHQRYHNVTLIPMMLRRERSRCQGKSCELPPVSRRLLYGGGFLLAGACAAALLLPLGSDPEPLRQPAASDPTLPARDPGAGSPAQAWAAAVIASPTPLPASGEEAGDGPDGAKDSTARRPTPAATPDPGKAADEIVRDSSRSPRDRIAAMEALAASWSRRDPVAALEWLARRAAQGDSTRTALPVELWEAAVGGFIEGVVSDDPEAAVIATELLDPHSPTPAGGSPTRSPGRDESTVGARSGFPDTPDGSEIADGEPSQEPAPHRPPAATDGKDLAVERSDRFPGDPGFPGDPDFLSPTR